MAEKEAEDFFKEEWVVEPGLTILSEGSVEAVVLTDTEAVVEEVEGTLVEAVGRMQIPTRVEEGEGLITLAQTSKMNVVTTQLATVR